MSRLKEKRVPLYRGSSLLYLGGLALIGFLIQAFTGVLLALKFEPNQAHGLQSLEAIIQDAPYGWFIHAVHAWTGSIAIALTFLHMVVAFFQRAYHDSGRSLWYSGIPMLVIVMAFAYTGWLLPRMHTELLQTFYILHVTVLPVAATLIIGLHLAQSIRRDSPTPTNAIVTRVVNFFPDFLVRESIVWLIAIAIIITIAWYLPWEFNGALLAPMNAIRLGIPHDWYLFWQLPWIYYLPTAAYWFIIALLIAILYLVPSYDTKLLNAHHERRITTAGIAGLLVLVALSLVQFFSSDATLDTDTAIHSTLPTDSLNTIATTSAPSAPHELSGWLWLMLSMIAFLILVLFLYRSHLDRSRRDPAEVAEK